MRLHLNLETIAAEQLSGGVSGTVLLISTADGSRLIVKQALPRLRVAAEWHCDPRRALRESAALRTLAPEMPENSVPWCLAEDDANCAFAMQAAPSHFRTWKSDLLAGVCSTSVAAQVGQAFAGFVCATTDRADIQAQFGDLATFESLRLQPYYEHLAERYPSLREQLASLCRDCTHHPAAIVHGDFSPKNLLTDGESVVVIDWECVHYGQPAFDLAFLLNHLLLKSFHRPDCCHALQSCALAFWRTSTSNIPRAEAISTSALQHLPALLLARVDGKSPAEYINTDGLRDQVRQLALDLFRQPPSSVQEIFERRSLLCP